MEKRKSLESHILSDMDYSCACLTYNTDIACVMDTNTLLLCRSTDTAAPKSKPPPSPVRSRKEKKDKTSARYNPDGSMVIEPVAEGTDGHGDQYEKYAAVVLLRRMPLAIYESYPLFI